MGAKTYIRVTIGLPEEISVTRRSKHTPGTWTLDSNGPPSIWAKTKRGDMKIADVRGWGHLTGIGALNLPEHDAIESQDANARLIAAAPDLLDACHQVCMTVAHAPEATLEIALEAMYEKCKAAIAKAEKAG